MEPTQLTTVAQKPVLRLLDICYGLGYNIAAALQTIWAVNPNCCVEVIGLELNPVVLQAAIAHQLFDNWNCKYIEILSQLANDHQMQTPRLKAKLLIWELVCSSVEMSKTGVAAAIEIETSYQPKRGIIQMGIQDFSFLPKILIYFPDT